MAALPSSAVGFHDEASPEERAPSAILGERVGKRAVENGNELGLVARRASPLFAICVFCLTHGSYSTPYRSGFCRVRSRCAVPMQGMFRLSVEWAPRSSLGAGWNGGCTLESAGGNRGKRKPSERSFVKLWGS